MLNNVKKNNLQKCEPSQIKIAFKDAYSIIRGVFSSRTFTFASPKNTKHLCVEHFCIEKLIDKMNMERAIIHRDAFIAFQNSNKYQFEELPVKHRAKARERFEGNTLVRGKLPA